MPKILKDLSNLSYHDSKKCANRSSGITIGNASAFCGIDIFQTMYVNFFPQSMANNPTNIILRLEDRLLRTLVTNHVFRELLVLQSVFEGPAGDRFEHTCFSSALDIGVILDALELHRRPEDALSLRGIRILRRMIKGEFIDNQEECEGEEKLHSWWMGKKMWTNGKRHAIGSVS